MGKNGLGVRRLGDEADLCYDAAMSQGQSATTLDGLLEPLSRCLDDESARRVAEFRVDPSVQARVDALAERANEGLLTAE